MLNRAGAPDLKDANYAQRPERFRPLRIGWRPRFFAASQRHTTALILSLDVGTLVACGTTEALLLCHLLFVYVNLVAHARTFFSHHLLTHDRHFDVLLLEGIRPNRLAGAPRWHSLHSDFLACDRHIDGLRFLDDIRMSGHATRLVPWGLSRD